MEDETTFKQKTEIYAKARELKALLDKVDTQTRIRVDSILDY